MSGQCQDCKAKDWRIEALTEDVEQLIARIKEIERKLADAESCVDDYHADLAESANKHSRKILAPPVDPWLGVWRAKKTMKDAFPTAIEVLEMRPNNVAYVRDGNNKGCLSVEFIQENFEKGTEEG